MLLFGTGALPILGQPLPYIMDMVYNNPGEEKTITKYNDPYYLKSQGFTSSVPHWYINCAITYDGFEGGVLDPNSEERTWIEDLAKWIDVKLDACEKAGIDVYPFTDFIVFPKSVWHKYGNQITGVEGGEAATGGADERYRKPNMQSKMVRKLIIAQVAEIFDRFPKLDGLVLRFGETYLHDTPHHMGGSPIRSGKAGIEDHIALIQLLREEICVKRNKKLFYRTWDFGFHFHNNPKYYLAVTNQIAPHQNLIFSIKYQQDDFHRMTPFNPCIGIGAHPQIVEAQSRMEAYGKGAHPYYSAKGVLDGWPETKYEITFGKHGFTGALTDPQSPRGVKDIVDKGLLSGIWTWSHGGGWEGPYIKHEIWADLNTYVISQWGQHPHKTEEELFYEFAEGIGLKGYQADLFRQLNLLSVEAVRKGHMNSYADNSVWWTRDHYFSVSSNKGVVDQILAKGKVDEVLAEKQESVALWQQIVAISKQINVPDTATQAAIEVSCVYGRIKYALIEQMWRMMLYHAQGKPDKNYDLNQLRNALEKYDKLWEEWRQLAKEPSCATIYTDMAFRNKVEGSIGELAEEIRQMIKE